MKKHFSLLLAGSMLVSGGSAGTGVFQKTEKIIQIGQDTEKEMNETFLVTGQEKPHEEIIAMSFDDIFASYGKVKGLEVIREHFLIEINNHRTVALHMDPVLTQIAQEQAQDMGDNTYFSHTNKQGISASDRAKGKYDYKTFGSNISFNLDNIKIIVQSYIDNGRLWNTGHDRIFASEYLELGIGLYKGSDGKYYIVADYGTKISK